MFPVWKLSGYKAAELAESTLANLRAAAVTLSGIKPGLCWSPGVTSAPAGQTESGWVSCGLHTD